MTLMRFEVVKRLAIIALLAAGAAGIGCGGSRDDRNATGTGGTGGSDATSTACPGTFNGSCRFRSGTDCIDYAGLPDSDAIALAEAACHEDGKGSWQDTPCTHTGAVGACSQMQDAACEGWWSYTGTLADLVADCTGDQGTWVNP